LNVRRGDPSGNADDTSKVRWMNAGVALRVRPVRQREAEFQAPDMLGVTDGMARRQATRRGRRGQPLATALFGGSGSFPGNFVATTWQLWVAIE
jgi:hypothetical protein